METDGFYDSTQQSTSSEMKQCKICGQVFGNDGPICNNCREKYIRFPIPKKVLIPVIIIICMVAVFLFTRFKSRNIL